MRLYLSYTSGQLELNQEGSTADPDCPALPTADAVLQLLCREKRMPSGTSLAPWGTALWVSGGLKHC